MHTIIFKIKCFLILSLFAGANTAFAATLYNLPFLADDLKPGERWSTKDHAQTTTQKFGFDLSVEKINGKTKKWSSIKLDSDKHWDNPKNSNYRIYGKPIYAMAAGEIDRCWRNAPENPRPKLPGETGEKLEEKMWLHKEYRNRRIPGGGNEIFVTHKDGSLALYAHMQPGSIPGKLCPNNNQLLSAPGNKEEVDVPEGKRAKVKKGAFLGLAGNSGNSTNPHLHIHLQKDGAGVKIKWARGLAADNSDDMADINKWTRFAGKTIPKGNVLIWPPRKIQKEYARHKYPEKDFQRLFDHLADSGYQMDWIDGYSVGGKPFLNFVWHPRKGAWRAFFGQSSAKYQKRVNDAKKDGFAPYQVESYLNGGKVRYAVIFKKNSKKWRARHELNQNQHQAVFDKAKKDGFRPVNVSVVSVRGKRMYTVLYKKTDLGGWRTKSKLDAKAYQKAVNDNKRAGRKPIYIAAYMHNGKSHFSVVFAQKPGGTWRAKHDLTVASYQTQWRDATKDGLLTRVATGYDGAKKNHRFAAMWRK